MAEEKQVTDIGKKCAFTGKTIKRVRRYYRNGLYFINKAAFQGWQKKQKEEGSTAAAAAAPAAEKAAPQKEEKTEEKKG